MDELDDAGNVLAWSGDVPFGGNQLKAYFWSIDTREKPLIPLYYDSAGPIDFGGGANENNFDYINLAPLWDNLGRNGRVSGAIVNADQHLQAATWTLADGVSVRPYAAPIAPDDFFPYSYITSTNQTGVSVGFGRGWGRSYSDPESGTIYREDDYWGGVDFSANPPSPLGGYAKSIWTRRLFELQSLSQTSYFYPVMIGDQGAVAGVVVDMDAVKGIPIVPPTKAGVMISGSLHRFISPFAPCYISNDTMPVVIGYQPSTQSLRRAVLNSGTTWDEGALKIWDSVLQKEVESHHHELAANERLEIVSQGRIIRNGVSSPLTRFLPEGWNSVSAADINNRGVILAQATRTIDDQGQPITDPIRSRCCWCRQCSRLTLIATGLSMGPT